MLNLTASANATTMPAIKTTSVTSMPARIPGLASRIARPS
jgi:hypothetical protein